MKYKNHSYVFAENVFPLLKLGSWNGMEEVVDFTLWLLYLQDALALLQIRV